MSIPDDAVIETWDSIYQKSLKLAQMIADDSKQRGERYDLMVVVPRGAYYIANIVAREFGFKATELIHASVGSYNEAEQGDFNIGQMPTRENITGKNLLLIDEVCDTGKTLDYLTNYLAENGANLIKTGVLHYKPALSKTDFIPDWAVETTDKWIVYPWEEHDEGTLKSYVHR